jgi:hypothetical protein
MTSASNASLIPQIKKAYQEAVDASKGTLQFAIKCGELLNLAKEGMEDKAWLSWLRDNFPEIPQTTASLYMRLAKHKDLFDKQRVASLTKNGPLSIRAAAALIPPTEAAQKAAETRAKNRALKDAEAARIAAQQSRASADLPELLVNAGPDEVVEALRQAKWELDAVKELVSLLTAVLNGKPTTTEEKLAAELSASSSSTFTRRTMPTNA